MKIWGVLEIENIFNKPSKSIREFHLMSLPSYQFDKFITNRLTDEEPNYDRIVALQEFFDTLFIGLNVEQKSVLKTIMESHET